jgi:hypothetical protein
MGVVLRIEGGFVKSALPSGDQSDRPQSPGLPEEKMNAETQRRREENAAGHEIFFAFIALRLAF